MRTTKFWITAVVAFAPPTFAQVGTISDLPQCGQQAILEAIQTSGCPLTDIACICKNTEFVDKLVAQIPQLCSSEDITLTADGSKAICMAYGVELDLPNLSGGANSTSTATTTSAAGSTVSTASSATGPTDRSTSADGSSRATGSTTNTLPSSTESGSSATGSSAAQETGSGAMVNTAGLSTVLAVALLGVAALS
ncbi:uncharacterized protein PV06_06502 [Exophiala oligosperma]|uniref:CFEM domain-containing protein n=1 Tax=Exophiala oligosperma TaxID=215243 RepID=A0A0D2DZ93_9EURO|nr:uncharacterized protein PV06_06502 [Exophiala oligosperma]KIW40889.1 hypothetical protein PV06_06502 [Exophiala oligosperma]